MKKKEYDVCIVGSGAGAGPIAYELSLKGFKVAVLEKGKFYKTEDFSKDEIANSRTSIYTPNLNDEFHTLEQTNGNNIKSQTTKESGRDFWNGNIVGGSSNFMAGYFHKLKPNDFKLESVYGKIEGSNVKDWPISFEEFEPYYEKAAKIIGVSGTNELLKPLSEHPFVEKFDKSCKNLNYKSSTTSRAILSSVHMNRKPCSYSNFCGSYGCSTDAKGSSRAALLEDAIKTGNCDIFPESFVYNLESKKSRVCSAQYFNRFSVKKNIKAKIFVVASQAIETSRLLLNSKNEEFKNGLSNNNGQVGKNIIFSAGGTGFGTFKINNKSDGLFFNRSLLDWYEIKDKQLGVIKGGIIDFLFEHANPISKATKLMWNNNDLLYGEALQDKMYNYFRTTKKIKYEIFCDWLPHDNCFVSIDTKNKDKYGINVAKIKIDALDHDIKVGQYLNDKAQKILEDMGASDIRSSISSSPPQNLQAGGCRFGNNSKTSVLNKNCKSHEVKNLYVADGSFMPTGGSVPFTWTIYANSFRISEIIMKDLKANYS